MRLVNENVDDILVPKNEDEIERDIRKLDFDTKEELAEELWGLDEESNEWKFIMDMFRVMGKYKFEILLTEMIILKQKDLL